MKKHLIYIIGIAVSLFTACENIPESERFIKIENPALNDTLDSDDSITILRTVLLEDYTGQMCSNCPNAHEQATALHNVYHDRLVIVSMHAGGLATPAPNGLMQPEGNEYADKAGVVDYPSGVVNRRTAAMTQLSDWPAKLREESQRPTDVKLTVEATAVDGKLDVVTKLYSRSNQAAKLQLWLLEDSIVALQRLPDASFKFDYVHNHVFRDAINGTWGEDVALVADEETVVEETAFALDASWKTKDLSVVAILYNDEGVVQATQAKVSSSANGNNNN